MSAEKGTPVERSQRARHPPSHLTVYNTTINTPSDAGSVPLAIPPFSSDQTPMVDELLDSTPGSEVVEVEVDEIVVDITPVGVGIRKVYSILAE